MNATNATPWPTFELTTANGATLTVQGYGAHITHWRSASQKPWIFTSQQAEFSEGKAIRGGVPIIFPQFNQMGSGPKHGFLRNTFWQCRAQSQPGEPTQQATFVHASNDTTRQLWPHDYHASFTLTLTDTALAMALSIINTGNTAFDFRAALHTYIAVSELKTTTLSGFNQNAYWDNGTPFEQRRQLTATALSFDDAIDRVVFDTQEPLLLQDGKGRLQIQHEGFADAVIWNPGIEGARALKDFADDEFNRMLCVEGAAIDQPLVLQPGEQWVGKQTLTELNNTD